MRAVIALRDLTKSFGKVVALDNINLQIYEGDIFGLLGPNGSGKSTLLKILLGLLFPSKGEATVFGSSVQETLNKNHIGFLPEIPQYYAFLTPLEVLDFYARLFNFSKKIRIQKIKDLLNLVGLYDYRERRLSGFSKGMLQRIGLACSLINDPSLLLLDEPTLGLDPIGASQMRNLFLKLKSEGKTLLLCSHLLSEVEYSCDRIGILHKGRLIKQGLLSELLRKTEQTQILTNLLTEEAKQKILGILKQQGQTQIKIEHPRQSLEELFHSLIKENDVK